MTTFRNEILKSLNTRQSIKDYQEFRPTKPISYRGKLGDLPINRVFMGIPEDTDTREGGKWELRFDSQNKPILLIYFITDAEIAKIKS